MAVSEMPFEIPFTSKLVNSCVITREEELFYSAHAKILLETPQLDHVIHKFITDIFPKFFEPFMKSGISLMGLKKKGNHVHVDDNWISSGTFTREFARRDNI